MLPAVAYDEGVRRRLGSTIRQARERAGLTQARLAERLDQAGDSTITQTAVSAWEIGRATPRPDRFAAIEEAIGLEQGTLARIVGLAADEPTLQISAEGVDLDELRELDPEAYGHVVDVARRELERARRARGAT